MVKKKKKTWGKIIESWDDPWEQTKRSSLSINYSTTSDHDISASLPLINNLPQRFNITDGHDQLKTLPQHTHVLVTTILDKQLSILLLSRCL